MQICFHEFGDDVDVVVSGARVGLDEVDQRDDVLVLEEPQELDLSKDTLGIDEIFECVLDLA